jgi:hypothetical protein
MALSAEQEEIIQQGVITFLTRVEALAPAHYHLTAKNSSENSIPILAVFNMRGCLA